MKILLHGYAGRMGRSIVKLAGDRVAAGIDTRLVPADFPVYDNWENCTIKGDVILDFSIAQAVSALLEYSVSVRLPAVLCTTGLTEKTLEEIKSAAQKIPIFQSYNMAVGVHITAALVKQIAKPLYDLDFDIEIVDFHHNQKKDAPSGTAVLLANSVNANFDEKLKINTDRFDTIGKRAKDEIGLHSLRAGNMAGYHKVIFAGSEEIIEITHTATDRDIFAKGALKAVEFIVKQEPGLYGMDDLIKSNP